MADQLMFDDLPAFDDMPEQAAAPEATPPLRFDDLPAFDDMPSGRPEPEGQLATFGREAAHSAVPAAAGFVGLGAGAQAGAALGALTAPVTGPVGPVVGGIVGGLGGMVAASMGANVAQEAALNAAGFDDSLQRAANREQNKWSAFAGEIAPGVAGASPAAIGGAIARQAAVRGAGAGIGGAFEAGQEYLNEGTVDPGKVAAAAAVGAVFPSTNRAGEALMGAGRRMVPGRPNQPANPAADAAHEDVGDQTPEVAASSSALAEPPPGASGVTTGNPQSAPARSERNYGKGAPVATGPDAPTSGDIAPDIAAAVKDPASPPERPPIDWPADPLERKDAPRWRDLPPDDPRGDTPPAPMPPDTHNLGVEPATYSDAPAVGKSPEMPTEGNAAPVVEAGFPQAGEPVAMGANDAAPVPKDMPAKAAKAIAKSKSSQIDNLKNQYLDAEQAGNEKRMAAIQKKLDALGVKPVDEEVTAAVTKPMPDLKGETPINDSITDGQKAAGNYPKARTHDFGKPITIETHAGDTRRSKASDPVKWEVKMPYDYGDFKKTKGADGDPIDFARPVKDDPLAGDKHFVIDQRNAETGQFDEHKVFTYVKDEAAARDLYARGFSDGKGPDRLGAITEVDRSKLVKWLQKHTTRAATKPYGDFDDTSGRKALAAAMGGQKPVTAAVTKAEPKVVAEARKLMVEQGLPEDALKAFDALEPGVRAAEATKFVNAKRSKTGVVKSAEVARVRPKPAEVPGAEGITARSKADAKRKGDALAAMQKAVSDTPPVEGESPQQLRDRLTKMVATGGDALKNYRPNVKPASYMMIKQAQQMLLRKTWKPAHVEAWNATEKLLRSGGKEGVEAVRGERRVEADIARSRRSGDDAIASAERNIDTADSVEDRLIAAIDEKNKGKFDVPHEEAESMVAPTPVKTKADLPAKKAKKVVDVTDSELAKIDTKPLDAAAKRKLEAAQLQAKAAKPKAESDAAPVKNIKVADPKEIERLNALLNKAAERGKKLETEVKSGFRDNIEKFLGDEGGELDLAKIVRDLKGATAMTPIKTYIAKSSKVPHSDYVRSLSDDLHKVSQNDKVHKVSMLQHLDSMPKGFNNPKTMEKVYLAREQGKLNILSPEELGNYNKYMKPYFDEIDAYVAAIRAVDPDRIGPDVANHISRIMKSESADFKTLADAADPTMPDQHGALHAISTSADAAKSRKFVALERVSDGKRFVISPGGNGYTLWQKYKSQRVKDPDFAFKAGDPYTVKRADGTQVDYIMRDAFTPEIEGNARGPNGKPIQYFKNAALSMAIAHTQLGSMARHLVELNRIMNTPQFEKLSAPANSKKANDMGWEAPRLANFKNIAMDPHLRYVFDDYSKTGFDTPEFVRQLSQNITKLLFWMPTAHAANVGAHWVVGRGWDWVTPKGTQSLVVDGLRAMKSVIQQDDLYKQMQRDGAGLIYGGVVSQKFTEKVFKKVGEDMVKNPSKWGPIADTLGVPLKKLYNAIYDMSAKTMWAINDMFLVQRILELERKGHSRKSAIAEAEQDIPNYRVPTTLITEGKWGRWMQQMATTPELLVFGRYHYGVFNSFANILKKTFAKDSTVGDRWDGLGKLAISGLLFLAAYPLWDKAIKAITGNEDAKAHRRGPAAVFSHVADAAEGKTDVMKAMRSTTTVPPLLSTAIETLRNQDFRGKQIVEPGDVRAAFKGDVSRAGRAALQFAEHKVKGLVSPYSTIANADKKDIGVLGAIRDTALDIKNPSKKGAAFERKVPVVTDREARSRFKHGGAGPGEKLYNKLTGYR